MPDLDRMAVESWLRRHEPEAASHALTPDIAADDMPGVLSEMVRLGRALDDALACDPDRLGALLQQPPARSALRMVLGHSGPARRARLLHWLSELPTPQRPQMMAGLLADDPEAAREADAGHIVRESIRQMNRSALLARLFSPERVGRLLAMCGGGEDAPCGT